jgi:hypothetical protein
MNEKSQMFQDVERVVQIGAGHGFRRGYGAGLEEGFKDGVLAGREDGRRIRTESLIAAFAAGILIGITVCSVVAL